MGLSYGVRKVAITARTTNGVQTISIPSGPGSLEPIIGYEIQFSGATVLNGIQTQGRRSYGMCDGTTQLACAHTARNNASAGSAHAGWRADREHVVELINFSNSASVGRATHDSVGLGQITINWGSTPADAAYHGYALLYFGDELQCHLEQLASHASAAGTASTTAPGWTPDWIRTMTVGQPFGRDADLDNFGDEGAFAMGGSGRLPSITQSCAASVVEHNEAPSSVGSVLRDNRCITHLLSTAGTISEFQELEITSYDASGFTVTSHGTGALTAAYLSFRVVGAGVRVWCGVSTVDVTGLGVESITDPGFRPRWMHALGATISETANTLNTTQARFSVGFANDLEQGCIGTFAQDGQATTNTRCLASDTRLVDTHGAATAHDYILEFDAFTLNGADVEVTDDAATVRLIAVQFIESRPSPGWLAASLQQRRSLALKHSTR